MAKIALLIGVSEYLPGLNPLPAAEQDVREMQRVLEHPEIGGFNQVQPLTNPSSQDMRIAIETLFTTCARDDLVLLYFSGHGVTDDNNRFYFASRDTQKTDQGLIRSTAVSANAVHDFMEDSRSKRKVVILDCCYSGAFAKGMTAKKLMDVVDIQTQLGGEGRAILTSSTSTQYSFEQKGSDLSVHTRYLIEGLETGAADCDEDGAISAEDLHTYTKQKVQEATLAMKPEIYVSREGFKIFLAQAPIADPAVQFRREVERLAQQGQIPDIHGDIPDVLLAALDAKSRSLELSSQYAETIMTEVLKPYRDHKRNLRTYERHFRSAIADDPSLGNEQRSHLRYLQQSLELSNEDVGWVEQRVLQPPDFASTSNNESTPLQNQSVVTIRSPNSIGVELKKTPKIQLANLKEKFVNALESFQQCSLLLWTIIVIPVGAIAVYLISEIWNISPQLLTRRKVSPPLPISNTESQSASEILQGERCIERARKEPLKLFNKPGGVYNGIVLQPGTKVSYVDELEPFWVQVNAEEGIGWTYVDNIEPCDS